MRDVKQWHWASRADLKHAVKVKTAEIKRLMDQRRLLTAQMTGSPGQASLFTSVEIDPSTWPECFQPFVEPEREPEPPKPPPKRFVQPKRAAPDTEPVYEDVSEPRRPLRIPSEVVRVERPEPVGRPRRRFTSVQQAIAAAQGADFSAFRPPV